MKEFIYQNKIWLGIIICLILIIIGSSITYVYYYNYKVDDCVSSSIAYSSNKLVIEEDAEVEEDGQQDNINYVYIDVKGAVKNPGVYKIEDNSIINDAINIAGGLKSTAITSNINLSKLVSNEMVIYVYDTSDYVTKNICEVTELTDDALVDSSIKDNDIYIDTEIKDKDSIIESDNNDSSSSNSSGGSDTNIINLNTASKDELMTLSGIGESKAIAIISYRENKLFDSIEEILNVSGIGDSTLEAIKTFITV